MGVKYVSNRIKSKTPIHVGIRQRYGEQRCFGNCREKQKFIVQVKSNYNFNVG